MTIEGDQDFCWISVRPSFAYAPGAAPSQTEYEIAAPDGSVERSAVAIDDSVKVSLPLGRRARCLERCRCYVPKTPLLGKDPTPVSPRNAPPLRNLLG